MTMREAFIDAFQSSRRRSAGIFDLVTPDAYYTRPIPLRNPIVFYEGHIPAFNVNTLLKKGLGREGLDPDYERLFARGIDPEDEAAAAQAGGSAWPAREDVQEYVSRADGAVMEALTRQPLELADRPALRRSQAIYTILEHELMHQETLLYMFHRVPHGQKVRPEGAEPVTSDRRSGLVTVRIPGGEATLGADPRQARFGWDNEFPLRRVTVPAFEIDVHNVTNGTFLEFLEAGGYDTEALWTPDDWRWRVEHDVRHPLFWERTDDTWVWRGMFEDVPLPLAWPVYVSHAEASACARWLGRRLPTEAEYHRAAFGTPAGEELAYPWGDAPPDPTRGNFGFTHWDPVPVGSYPDGQSAWGVHDLVGNGWEWTSTVFAGFPGFEPMPSYPEYSADFFDGAHYVIKGASPATATELVRRSLRNWFRPHYPYVYATFRCASTAD